MIKEGEVVAQKAKDAFGATARITPGNESKKLCPRCGVATDVFNYSYDSNVFLNRCPVCHGVWADRGEVEHVACYLKGNPAVNKYAESFAEELAAASKTSLIVRLLKSRLLSGIIVLVELGVAIATGHPEYIFTMVLFFIFALCCIWFADSIGSYTGFFPLFRPSPPITKKTPGVFIAFIGWLLLLVPLWSLV
jgi:Zn-finger nucleic acid-binding protein